MTILGIRVLGDPVLRQSTEPLIEVTDDTRALISDMFDTMHAAEGIGLAAPQVGRSERVAVMDVDGASYALVNPEIIEREGSARGEEGCLSIPEVFGEVDRATRVVVRALDENGQQIEVEATELLARCIQHEVDHLDGKLFLDYLSVLKRRSALSRWDRLKNDYPGFIRRVVLERRGPEHSEGEL
ncbi:MAG: peptide deformylase [Gemmatimonadaceae bacterium]